MYLHTAPDLGTFHGRRDDDWQKFKTKLKAHYAATGQAGRQAADQLSRYLDGPAYQFWDTQPQHIKTDLKQILEAFDKRYSDDMKQEYYQQMFDSIMYQGYDKETYDDLSTRIQSVATKAYPDYTDRQGLRMIRDHVRESYVRRKFYDCLTPDIRKQMFVHFRTREAPLAKMLEYAKILQVAEMQMQQDDLPYEAAYTAMGGAHHPAHTPENLAEITEILKSQSQQLDDLRQMQQSERPARSARDNNQERNARPRSRSPPDNRSRQDRFRPTQRNSDPPSPRRNTLSQQRSPRSVTFSDDYRPPPRYPIRPRSADTRPRCFQCNMPGHYARYCQAPPTNRQRFPNQQGNRPTSPRPWNVNRQLTNVDQPHPRGRPDANSLQQFSQRYNENLRNDRYGTHEQLRQNPRAGWQRQDNGPRQQEFPNRNYQQPQAREQMSYDNRPQRHNSQPEEHRERRTPMHTMPLQRISPREAARAQNEPNNRPRYGAPNNYHLN